MLRHSWIVIGLAACSGPEEGPSPPPQERVLQGPFVGQSVHVADVDGDGRATLAVSAPGLLGDGGVHLFDGLGDLRLADADGAIVSAGPAQLGPGFAPCGDIDGDGNADWVVGAPDRDRTGGAWLINGPITGQIELSDQVFTAGTVREGRLGFTVSCGDVDGDGLSDLALSAPDTDGFGVALQTGTVSLHSGGSLDNVGSLSSTWSNSHLGFRHGMSMGADLDGDGVGDLVVGAHGAERVHLLFGPLGGTYEANNAGPMLTGLPNDGTGHAIATGDIDGDGSTDIVIGAPFSDDDRGAIWVLRGPLLPDLFGPLEGIGTRITGISEGDEAGFAVAVADVDADGSDDLWIGAPGSTTSGQATGAAYLVFGPGDSATNLDQAAGRVLGDADLGRLGWAVAAGDLDGDGGVELVASAPEANVDGILGAGLVYAWPADAVRGLTYPDSAVLTIKP